MASGNHANRLSVIDHIEEFRIRLIRCLVVTVLLVPAAWPVSLILIDWIIRNLCPPELGTLYYTAPMELFFLRIKFSLILAVCVALPVWMMQLWKYISPGLYRQEVRTVAAACASSFILFAVGAAMALFGIFPILMRYSMSMQTENIKPLLSVNSCLTLSFWLMLGFGLCFQLPIIFLGLIKLGVAGVATLRRLRPYVVVGIFIVAAIFTPPDLISQLAMGIPTWLLYELSLVVGGRIERRRSKTAAAGESEHALGGQDLAL